eukprot:comp18327_c0_seq1/m.19403 comp18327_c0_seq1/g.19403  ORF comp18327_c0_seq1/g.19403 comp18327_c0_seq1/m.19403 type:complete len:461 (-) comp18327_c0_seq1:117-1499(-)
MPRPSSQSVQVAVAKCSPQPEKKAGGMRRAVSLKDFGEALQAHLHLPGRSKLPSNQSFRALTELAGKENDFHYDLSQFDVIKQVGSGAFGKVQLCKHIRTGETVVLKIIRKSFVVQAKEVDHVKEEVDTMTQLAAHDCPFVVKTLGTFQDDKNIYYVMEYISGGELFSHLRSAKKGRFSERRARFYVAELMCALGYMHEKEHIVYRDLKPENMILDEKGHLKLIDFGFAKHISEDDKTYTLCGTPDYVAPEVVKGEGYNKEADLWSLGVFIYELIVGRGPFITVDRQGRVDYKDILSGSFGFPRSFELSKEVKDLIVSLLQVDRSRRLGAKGGMAEIKAHPWFKGIDWDAMGKMQVKPPKPGKYKKGMVNLQPGDAKPSSVSTEIDQSLFENFDTVVKVGEEGIVAERVSLGNERPVSFAMGSNSSNESLEDLEEPQSGETMSATASHKSLDVPAPKFFI